ncbi:MAG: CdaR family protein [Clostridiales bacterium]|nr:CdaR family protein [Clostridiales bacterium]
MNKVKNKKGSGFWLYKLAAIASAILIWVFVTVTQNPLTEVRHTVPVELRGLAENLSMDIISYQVNVRVQGTSATISNINAADIEAYADFTGLSPGEATVDVIVELPESVQLIAQSLKSITVALKEKRAEIFPLEVEIMGETADNYIMLEPVLSPSEVRLWGTDDLIRRVGKVYVAASVQDIAESLEKDLSIMVLDTAGNDITNMFTAEPEIAKVVAPVVYNQPERILAVRVPITGEPALGYQLSLISVTPQTVRVFGDLNRLQSLYFVETEPVDISELRLNTSLTANLALGSGFSSDKRQVTVALQIEPVNYANFTKTLVITYNLGNGLIAEVEQREIKVTVYGPETFVAVLDEVDIVPYVDCSELEEGLYTLPIRIALPANIMLVNISVDTLEVSIYDPNANMADGAPLMEDIYMDGGDTDKR